MTPKTLLPPLGELCRGLAEELGNVVEGGLGDSPERISFALFLLRGPEMVSAGNASREATVSAIYDWLEAIGTGAAPGKLARHALKILRESGGAGLSAKPATPASAFAMGAMAALAFAKPGAIDPAAIGAEVLGILERIVRAEDALRADGFLADSMAPVPGL
jgi:hypothetical protein